MNNRLNAFDDFKNKEKKRMKKKVFDMQNCIYLKSWFSNLHIETKKKCSIFFNGKYIYREINTPSEIFKINNQL